MTQTELGQIVGAGKQSISDWERGITGPTRKHFLELAKALKIDLDTLLRLSGTTTTGKKKPLSAVSNVRNAPKIKVDTPVKEGAGGLLPLLTWEQAIAWGGQLDTTETVAERLPCAAEHSANAFYLEVVGDSMQAPSGEISFREGDRIAIDPKRKPSHRNFVLVAIGDDTLLLRQVLIEGGKKFLKAINPNWPDGLTVLHDDDRIVGTVIERIDPPPKPQILV